MNTNELADWLRSNIEWSRFCTLVSTVGDELNERKLRFDKSDLFEKSLEKFSNGQMRYINVEGIDHVLPDSTTVEMKYTQDCLFTSKTQKQKKHVSDLQLMNSRGSSEGRDLPESYADFLLICDNNSAAVIDKQTLTKYCISAGDGLKTSKLPSSIITYVFLPSDIQIQNVEVESYKEAKIKMQEQFLDNF